MRGFWFRIALGALLVFIVGMSAIQVVRRATEPARTAMRGTWDSSAPASPGIAALTAVAAVSHAVAQQHAAIPKAEHPIAFLLEGAELGQVTRLFAERRKTGERAIFALTVRLYNPTSIPQIMGCELVPINDVDDNFDFEDGFRCLERGERGYEAIGTVRFLPGDMTRPVRVRASSIKHLEEGDPFKVNVDLSRPLQLDVEGAKGEKFALHANDGQAVMRARDGDGRERLRLVADSSGAFLQVVNDQGRVVFRMAANHSGVTMTAKE